MKYVYYSIIAILFIALAWVYFTKPEPSEPIVKTDTLTVIRYLQSAENGLKPPTLIQKPFINQSKPDTIYTQHIDTVTLTKYLKYELMLGIEKQGTDLKVFALNPYGQLLSERTFKNVYGNFTAFSGEKEIVVKSQLWQLTPLVVTYNMVRPINNLKEFNHSVGLQSELNFIDRYTLGLGVNYDLNKKDVSLKGEIKIKIY